MKRVGRYWLPDADHHFVGDLDQYQRAVYEKAKQFLRGNGLAVDVGAHVGIFSRRMMDDFSEVVSFEPDARNYSCLVRNCIGVVPIFGGLGSQGGFGNVRVDAVANTGARGFEDTASGQIPMYALDEFDLSPNLIKIDTEGFEQKVLVGALKTLQRSRPVIIVERPSEGAINVLRLADYKLVEVVNKDSIFVGK